MTSQFAPLESLVGGVILGSASACVALYCGRITGISGLCTGVLTMAKDWSWRLLFLCGLITGGILFKQISESALPLRPVNTNNSDGGVSLSSASSLVRVVIAGALIGVGSSVGNGCTSGHGICGLARLSPRSLAHVMTFMAAGLVAVKLFGTSEYLDPTTVHAYRDTDIAPLWETPSWPTSPGAASRQTIFASTVSVALVCACTLVFAARHQDVQANTPLASTVSHAAAYFMGLMFACGLILSGMTDSFKVASFLDLGQPYWNPSLALVMIGAIGSALPAFARLESWKAAGITKVILPSETNRVPSSQWTVDKRLLFGAVLFGLGWGIGGCCPGPSVVMLGAYPFALTTLVFSASMLGGMWAAETISPSSAICC